MTTFFTSDTHFGHRNILRLSNRPFRDIEHHNETLVENWNSVVEPDDTVIHLGDVALGPIHESLQYIKRLNGYKILVVGNHDRNFRGGKRSAGMEPHEWDLEYSRIGFHEVWMNYSMGIGGRDINLSHFPYEGDSHDGDRYNDYRLTDNGAPLVHGHTHSHGSPVTFTKKGTLQIHVGVDAWDYTPVSEHQVEDLLRGILG